LCEKYLLALGAFGQAPGEIDTLVLGCTHYPFASSELQMLAGESVRLLEPGTPVARRVYQVLQTQGLLANRGSKTSLLPLATGETRNLQQALWHWLGLSQQVIKV
jgi:glutamate racemase